MSAALPKLVESPSLEPSCRDTAAHALSIVRDGVITGEGPTTKGRVHFSRSIDADDTAEWESVTFCLSCPYAPSVDSRRVVH